METEVEEVEMTDTEVEEEVTDMETTTEEATIDMEEEVEEEALTAMILEILLPTEDMEEVLIEVEEVVDTPTKEEVLTDNHNMGNNNR